MELLTDKRKPIEPTEISVPIAVYPRLVRGWLFLAPHRAVFIDRK